ncbi:hypothetical protein GGR55DRAFT_104694 [Xylaria sp. FL0064]|nr:hypothetical protein GGR55DRAFT_104694 [Xylaria sp. FL0064]
MHSVPSFLLNWALFCRGDHGSALSGCQFSLALSVSPSVYLPACSTGSPVCTTWPSLGSLGSRTNDYRHAQIPVICGIWRALHRKMRILNSIIWTGDSVLVATSCRAGLKLGQHIPELSSFGHQRSTSSRDTFMWCS